MRLHQFKAILKAAVSGAALLLLGVGSASGATVNVSAGPATAKLPDGTSVPMWGYSCGPASTLTVTCSALNKGVAAGNWSPIVITVPFGTDLSINLHNNLVSAGEYNALKIWKPVGPPPHNALDMRTIKLLMFSIGDKLQELNRSPFRDLNGERL